MTVSGCTRWVCLPAATGFGTDFWHAVEFSRSGRAPLAIFRSSAGQPCYLTDSLRGVNPTPPSSSARALTAVTRRTASRRAEHLGGRRGHQPPCRCPELLASDGLYVRSLCRARSNRTRRTDHGVGDPVSAGPATDAVSVPPCRATSRTIGGSPLDGQSDQERPASHPVQPPYTRRPAARAGCPGRLIRASDRSRGNG